MDDCVIDGSAWNFQTSCPHLPMKLLEGNAPNVNVWAILFSELLF